MWISYDGAEKGNIDARERAIKDAKASEQLYDLKRSYESMQSSLNTTELPDTTPTGRSTSVLTLNRSNDYILYEDFNSFLLVYRSFKDSPSNTVKINYIRLNGCSLVEIKMK